MTLGVATEQEKPLAVRRSDWAHLKVSLAKLQEARPKLTVGYAVCFAIAAASVPPIFLVSASSNLPPWVAPLYVCATLSAVIIGAILAWLERRYGQEIRNRLRDIDVDLQEIEQSAEHESTFV